MAESIFPFIDIPPDATVAQPVKLPLFREYAWDFETNDFLYKDGEPVTFEGAEALKVWIYMALKTERYRYLAFSWNFGQDFDNLVGSGLTPQAILAEADRYAREALLVNPYITEVTTSNLAFDGETLQGEVNVDTVYGEVRISV